jgi:hypothetical protein
MLLRPAYLSQTLDRPLPTKDGGTLHTLGSGGERHRQETRATEPLAACRQVLVKEDVLTVSKALELALFYDTKLDVSKVR